MEYVIGIVILAALGYLVYSTVSNSPLDNTPVAVKEPKVAKLSKARLTALTKAQLVEKGNELGVKVNTREVKSKIVNQVYKAQ